MLWEARKPPAVLFLCMHEWCPCLTCHAAKHHGFLHTSVGLVQVHPKQRVPSKSLIGQPHDQSTCMHVDIEQLQLPVECWALWLLTYYKQWEHIIHWHLVDITQCTYHYTGKCHDNMANRRVVFSSIQCILMMLYQTLNMLTNRLQCLQVATETGIRRTYVATVEKYTYVANITTATEIRRLYGYYHTVFIACLRHENPTSQTGTRIRLHTSSLSSAHVCAIAYIIQHTQLILH